MLTRIKHRFRRISETAPDEFKLERIAVSDFTAAVKDFVFENFRGAMTVEKPPVDSGYITVSPRGFAYFLKLLLNEIYGEGMLRAKIVTENGRIEVIIELPNIGVKTDELLSCAVNSGFSVERADNREIVLFANTAKDKAMSIYAIDFAKFKRYLNEIFFL